VEENDLILSDAPSWANRLCDMALACSGAFASEEARHLRACHSILLAAPVMVLPWAKALPAADRIEALLQAGASESAALALLGDRCGYMLSRGVMGEALATIALPGGNSECSAKGDTLALAIVAALAQALSEACQLPISNRAAPQIPALRFN
jgi:hypothetical protein